MVKLVCVVDQRKTIETVSFSNDTIHSKISDVSTNILNQVISEIEAIEATPFPFISWMKVLIFSNASNC